MIFNKNKNQKGFTLIETFVAISVLVIVVLGPMSLLSRALQNSRQIAEEITASYLAQEGVELMIGQRNSAGRSWSPDPGVFSCQLKWFDTDGYQCSNGNQTIFKREISSTEKAGGGKQWEIISTVTRPGSGLGSVRPPIVSSSIIFKNN